MNGLSVKRKKIEPISVTKKSKYPIPNTPPTLALSVKFKEPSGNDVLDAEEKGAVYIEITNHGKGSAYGILTSVKPKDGTKGINFGPAFFIDELPPGKTMTGEITLEARTDIPDQTVNATVSMTEANGFEEDPVPLTFTTRRFQPSDLALVDVGINDGNDNGVIEPAEVVEVTARLTNKGYAVAKQAKATLELGENVYLAQGSPRTFDIGDVKKGEYRDIRFSFYTNKRATEIPIKLALTESRGSSKKVDVPLALNRPQRRTESIVVEAKADANAMAADKPPDPLSEAVDRPRPTKANQPDAIAIVIGNKDYTNRDVVPVDFAARDATIMAEYLKTSMGFQPGNVVLVTNAGKGKLESLFGTESNPKGRLYSMVKPGKSDVFIYYTGHGAPDVITGKAFLVPVDADPVAIGLNGYSLDVLYRNLAQVPARTVTVVIDACFSGGSERGTIIPSASPLFVEATTPAGGNVTVLSSTSKGQISSWYNEKKHSLFTYLFLKGLQGEADLDHDGVITIGEMHRYLADGTRGVPYYARLLYNNREQVPAFSGDADRPLVKY